MILYTVMPIDAVLQNDMPNELNKIRIVQYDGYQLEVSLTNGQNQVQRIYSTNLNDYLNPKLQPGNVVNIPE